MHCIPKFLWFHNIKPSGSCLFTTRKLTERAKKYGQNEYDEHSKLLIRFHLQHITECKQPSIHFHKKINLLVDRRRFNNLGSILLLILGNFLGTGKKANVIRKYSLVWTIQKIKSKSYVCHSKLIAWFCFGQAWLLFMPSWSLGKSVLAMYAKWSEINSSVNNITESWSSSLLSLAFSRWDY